MRLWLFILEQFGYKPKPKYRYTPKYIKPLVEHGRALAKAALKSRGYSVKSRKARDCRYVVEPGQRQWGGVWARRHADRTWSTGGWCPGRTMFYGNPRDLSGVVLDQCFHEEAHRILHENGHDTGVMHPTNLRGVVPNWEDTR